MTDSNPRPMILVAEDDDAVCELISIWFGGDYRIVVAHDGDAAMTLAHRMRPDIVLIDVMMPMFSGFSLSSALDAHPELSRVPRAFMTAHPDAGQWLERDERLGGATSQKEIPILVKPFDRDELRATLERLLAGRESTGTSSEYDPSRYSRVDAQLTAELRASDGSMRSVDLLSLSHLGAYVQTDNGPEIGSHWTLRLRGVDGSLALPVEVIHAMERSGVPGAGLFFRGLSEAQSDSIAALIRQLEAPHSG